MNLELALKALARKAVPMTNTKGQVVPAIPVSDNIDDAIEWLIARYNDGTLRLEGYNFQQEVRKSKIQTHKTRNSENLSRGGFMRLTDFARATGFGLKTVKNISKKAKAYVPIGDIVSGEFHPSTAPTLINVDKFYAYLDRMAENEWNERFVTVSEAAFLTGFTENEIREKVKAGEFRVDERKDTNRKYAIYRTSLYTNEKFMPKKGATDGKNNHSSE